MEGPVIRVDGSQKSGSGTILRHAVALASLSGEELEMTHIRAHREKPGLRPQHLRSLLACCEMTGGTVEGAAVDSTRIVYRPGTWVERSQFSWDIGTAGSTTMLAFTILPLAIFSGRALEFTITGGLFQDFAPSAFHMQRVLFAVLSQMGVKTTLRVVRPGYVPKGGGIIQVESLPVEGALRPLSLLRRGHPIRVSGISLSSHLGAQQVSQRMAQCCQEVLCKRNIDTHFEIVEDDTALQKGAALFVCAQTDTGCLIGADWAGAPGRTSERIGAFVARSLLEDLDSGATVDRHLADQMIIFAGLASGTTEYIVPRVTEHVETNLWLIETMLGAKTSLEGQRVRIEGIGFRRGP